MINFFKKTPPQPQLSAQEVRDIAADNAERVIREAFSKPVLETVTMDQPVTKDQTVNDIIEEIHDSFYGEVEKLLAEAKISNSLETEYQTLIDKCERLKALGFTNTAEVKSAEAEIGRLRGLKNANDEKEILINAIEYFSSKYPNYKFITTDSVTKICEKYGLVRGSTDKYIGTVPDKNLKHIEDFKVDEIDDCYITETFNPESVSWDRLSWFEGYIHGAEFKSKKIYKLDSSNGPIYVEKGSRSNNSLQITWETLNIVAPLKDFDMKKSELKGTQIIDKVEIPDPIVLKPVCYKNRKYFLIVTAWGIEAADELVVNPNHN
jgi:hypothetical protein